MDKMWAPWRSEYIDSFAGEKESECFLCDALKAQNEQDVFIVEKTKRSFVILNIYPYNTGHVMVVPNRHLGELESLSQKELLDTSLLVQKAIKALKKAYRPHGINIGMNLGRPAGAGLETHVHFHVVPRWNGDTNFMAAIADTKVLSESLRESYKKLKKAFKELKAEQ